MYKIEGKWVDVQNIYRSSAESIDPNAESWQIKQAMNEAELTITECTFLRDDIKGLQQAPNSAKDLLERDDIMLLCIYGEDSIYIILDPSLKKEFLSKVGPTSKYDDDSGNREEL